jgi:hypothetical protein
MFQDGHLYYIRRKTEEAVIIFCTIREVRTEKEKSKYRFMTNSDWLALRPLGQQCEKPFPHNLLFVVANFDWREFPGKEPYFERNVAGHDEIREIHVPDLPLFVSWPCKSGLFTDLLINYPRTIRFEVEHNSESLCLRSLL